MVRRASLPKSTMPRPRRRSRHHQIPCSGARAQALPPTPSARLYRDRYGHGCAGKGARIDHRSDPVGRLGEPEEIARCVSFLASDDAGLSTARPSRPTAVSSSSKTRHCNTQKGRSLRPALCCCAVRADRPKSCNGSAARLRKAVPRQRCIPGFEKPAQNRFQRLSAGLMGRSKPARV